MSAEESVGCPRPPGPLACCSGLTETRPVTVRWLLACGPRLWSEIVSQTERTRVGMAWRSGVCLSVLITRSNVPSLSADRALWLARMPLYHVESASAGDRLQAL